MVHRNPSSSVYREYQTFKLIDYTDVCSGLIGNTLYEILLPNNCFIYGEIQNIGVDYLHNFLIIYISDFYFGAQRRALSRSQNKEIINSLE